LILGEVAILGLSKINSLSFKADDLKDFYESLLFLLEPSDFLNTMLTGVLEMLLLNLIPKCELFFDV
jgi:hypothetical protein